MENQYGKYKMTGIHKHWSHAWLESGWLSRLNILFSPEITCELDQAKESNKKEVI